MFCKFEIVLLHCLYAVADPALASLKPGLFHLLDVTRSMHAQRFAGVLKSWELLLCTTWSLALDSILFSESKTSLIPWCLL